MPFTVVSIDLHTRARTARESSTPKALVMMPLTYTRRATLSHVNTKKRMATAAACGPRSVMIESRKRGRERERGD